MPVQNKDIRRKLRLRQELVLRASDGAVYVPFCGDGEMAEAYAGRAIYAADIDQKRVETFRKRFPDARVKAADVNKEFPFSESDTIYSIADFDAWDYPYDALRLFMSAAQTTDRLVIFITDGMFQAITRKRTARGPDGTPILGSQCRSLQKYLSDFVLTYLRKILSPRTIREESHFTINDMIYLGIVAARIDNGQASEMDADSLDVERVLRESRDSRRMGRPKWELTDERLRVIEIVAEMHATEEEIARALGVSVDTISRRLKEKLGCTFEEILKKRREIGAISLRRWQWEAAKAGNIPMLIWLGKQYLGQRDRQDVSYSKEKLKVVERIVAEDSDADSSTG